MGSHCGHGYTQSSLTPEKLRKNYAYRMCVKISLAVVGCNIVSAGKKIPPHRAWVTGNHVHFRHRTETQIHLAQDSYTISEISVEIKYYNTLLPKFKLA